MSQAERLNVSVAPAPGESLNGWLLRIAAANRFYPIDWLRDLFHRRALSPKSLGDPRHVAHALRAELHEVEPMLYPEARSGGRLNHLFNGVAIHGRRLDPRNVKLCPACLRERPIHLARWEVVPITACERHRRVLIDHCSECSKKLTSRRPSPAICICGARLDRVAGGSRISSPLTELTWLMAHKLRATDHPRPSFMLPPDLEQASIDDLVTAATHMGHASSHYPTGKGERRLSNVELADVLDHGAHILCDWPARYHRLLDRIATDEPASDKGAGVKVFGTEYTRAIRSRSRPGLDFHYRAFADYARTRLPASQYAINSETEAIEIEGVAYLSPERALSKYGLAKSTSTRLISRGILPVHVHRLGSRRFTYIREDGLLAYLATTREHIPWARVSSRLGCRAPLIRQLVAWGFIRMSPWQGPHGKEGESGYYLADVNNIARWFALGRRLPCIAGDATMINWHEIVWRFAAYEHAGLAVIDALRGDRLTPVGRRRGRRGIGAAMFSLQEVARIVTGLPGDELPVTRMDAGRQLGIPARHISALIDNGTLGAGPHHRVREWSSTTRRAIREFRAKYIHASEAGKDWDLGATQATAVLRKAGLTPVRGHRGRWIRYFRRDLYDRARANGQVDLSGARRR